MAKLKEFLAKFKKIFGILGLLIAVVLFTACMAPDSFLKAENIENTVKWTALYGVISVGVSFVIMTGGIDLSIGSVIALVGCVLAMSLHTTYEPVGAQRVLRVEALEPDRPEANLDAQDNEGASSEEQPNRVLVLEQQASGYKPGDRLQFYLEIYTVESVNGDRIVVKEDISDAGSGTLSRVLEVESVAQDNSQTVRVGGEFQELCKVVFPDAYDEFSSGDRMSLIDSSGLLQEYTVHTASVTGSSTEVQLYVRPGVRVSQPSGACVELRKQPMSTPMAICVALSLALLIGLVHGLLITKVKLQPFVVTLCGLLIYRGTARYVTGDSEQGFGNEYLNLKEFTMGKLMQYCSGQEFVFDIPMSFVFLILLAVVAAIFLNKTIFGRYILALGRNEEAARYSGIQTDRMVILSYMICSFCAGLAAILFALDINSIQPASHGEFYELYAIAAAVLGGCSLRGGEGTILGVVIATAVMRVLNNAINLIPGIDTSLEFAIIGMVILLGVIADETVRRIAANRKVASS
ncbi:MAG: ABC transporter permease [Planctomycetota bacterium]